MTGHNPTYARYARGKSIPFNRPVYGYHVHCECGWNVRVNGTLREAKQAHAIHRQAVREAI